MVVFITDPTPRTTRVKTGRKILERPVHSRPSWRISQILTPCPPGAPPPITHLSTDSPDNTTVSRPTEDFSPSPYESAFKRPLYQICDEPPPNAEIKYLPEITWGSIGLAAMICPTILTLTQYFLVDLGQGTLSSTIGGAMIYLGLTVIGSCAADLAAKLGTNFSAWAKRVDYVKIKDLLEEAYATSFVYPLLAASQLGVQALASGHQLAGSLSSFMVLGGIDAMARYYSRIHYRHFPQKIAEQDMWRPFFGTGAAILTFSLFGVSIFHSWIFLQVVKLFKVLWTSIVVGYNKYQEKLRKREQDFVAIFSTERYREPFTDPFAAQAINLVHILADKSLAGITFPKFVNCEARRALLSKIHAAMRSNSRIKAAAKAAATVYAPDPKSPASRQAYVKSLLTIFKRNRDNYLANVRPALGI